MTLPLDEPTPRRIRQHIAQLAAQHDYHTFISYARDPDAALARRLRRTLSGVARRWWQRQGLRVFLDVASLPAGQSLRHEIQSRLHSSSGLVLLACPASAASRWVGEEIRTWWELDRPAPVLMVTGGTIAWDETAGDFDWDHTTALDRTLFTGRYPEQPLWIDLRDGPGPAPGDAPRRSRRHLADAAVAAAAAVLGLRREVLAGHERRRQRRQLALAVTVAVLVGALGVAAALAAQRAREQARERAAEQLVRQAQAAGERVDRSLLLHAAAYRIAPHTQADTLWQAAAAYPGLRQVLRAAVALGTVDGVAYSPDGRWLAAATSVDAPGGVSRAAAVLWPASGEGPGVVLPVGSVAATSVAFSPDSSVLAVGGTDGAVSEFRAPAGDTWPASDPATVRAAPPGPAASPAEHLSFSPDGRRLAVSHGSAGTRLWPRGTGRPAVLPGTGAEFGPDGATLATIDTGGVVIRRADTLAVTRTVPLAGATALAYRTPDELAVLAAGGVSLVGPGTAVRAVPATAASVVLAADGATVVTDTALVTLPAGPGNPAVQLRRPVAMARSVALRPGGGQYAVGGHWLDRSLAGAVTLWDTGPGGPPVVVAGGQVRRPATGASTQVPLEPGVQAPTALAQDDGGTLAAALGGRQLTLWRLADGTARSIYFPPGAAGGAGLAFTPDGALLAATRPDGRVQILRTASGTPQPLVLLDPGTPARDLAFTPGGADLAVATAHGVQLWHTTTWTTTSTVAAGADVRALAWDGTTALVVTDGTHVDRWQLDGAPPTRLPDPDPTRGDLARLAASAGVLAAATEAGVIALWDLPGARRLDTVLPAPVPLMALTFTDQGRTLAATGPYPARWSLDPETVVHWICDVAQRDLEPAEWQGYGLTPSPTGCGPTGPTP